MRCGVILEYAHQRATRHAAVLHRVAHENQLELEFFRQLEQPHRLLVPQHRGLVHHDAPAPRRRLELGIDQKAGDGVGLESFLFELLDRSSRRSQVRGRFAGHPHPLVELLKGITLAGARRAFDDGNAVARSEQALGELPLFVVERPAIGQGAA